MSVILSILEQLQRERSTAPVAELEPSENPDLRTSRLGCHAAWYRENLGPCSEAMLQYEWAWLNGRIAALLHCRDGQGASLDPACPSRSRLAALLSESQLFRTLLLQEFASRSLRPLPPLGTVVPTEEAWEITSSSVRQEWGIAG